MTDSSDEFNDSLSGVFDNILAVEHSTDSYGFVGGSAILNNVHSEDKCRGRVCVVHSPTNHHMRSWKQLWRNDRGIFERICPEHGIGHPDPDQFEYWDETGQEYQAVHGCCGCCRPPSD